MTSLTGRTRQQPARSGPLRSTNRTTWHIIIGVAIMPVVSVLPPPEPITDIGMAAIGVFAGVIYLWTFVGLAWPSILGIIGASFFINSLLQPPSEHGIWKAIQESIGNWVVGFIIVSLMLTYALNASGLTRRIAVWFLRRQMAQTSPWAFTGLLFASCFAIGLFLDLIPTLVFFIALSTEIFQRLGYRRGDAYPMVVLIGLAFTVNVAFAITPISHPVTLIGLGVFEQTASGQSISFGQYMAVGIPVGIVIVVLMALFFRFGLKPDVAKFKDVDHDSLVGERPGKLTVREKLVGAVFLAVVATWVLPGLVGLFAPNAAFVTVLNDLTVIFPAALGVILLLILRVDREPLLEFEGALKQMPWDVIVLVACAMLYGTLLTAETTGINSFIVDAISPAVASSSSTFWTVAVIVAVVAVITNVANNVPVTILFVASFVPLAESLGIDSGALGILIVLAGQMGFVLPSSVASVALIYGNRWVAPSRVLAYGLVTLFISFIALVGVGYPLAVALT